MASKSNGSIYTQLKKDHQELKKILKQMVGSKESEGAKRKKLLREFKENLLAHALAEEKLLYTELERHKRSHDLALEAEEEHHVAVLMLRELEQCDVADEHWKAKATVLKEMLEHHIEEEEDEMFATAHRVLDKDMEQEMAQRFPQQKQQEIRAL